MVQCPPRVAMLAHIRLLEEGLALTMRFSPSLCRQLGFWATTHGGNLAYGQSTQPMAIVGPPRAIRSSPDGLKRKFEYMKTVPALPEPNPQGPMPVELIPKPTSLPEHMKWKPAGERPEGAVTKRRRTERQESSHWD